MVVDDLAARTSSSLRSHKVQAAAAEVRLASFSRAIIARPITYMNESGGPVA